MTVAAAAEAEADSVNFVEQREQQVQPKESEWDSIAKRDVVEVAIELHLLELRCV